MYPSPVSRPRPVRELIAESPLTPVAIAATLGLIADRYLGLSPLAEFAVLGIAVVGFVMLARRRPDAPPVAAWLAVAALAALYHHAHRNVFTSDDIGNFVSETPTLVRVRGVLDEEPSIPKKPRPDPLASFLRPDPTRSVLRIREVQSDAGWITASGKAHLTVEGQLRDMHLGDEVEVFGWLENPQKPGNPGGFDWAEHLRDDRIRAIIRVRGGEAVTRLNRGWSTSPRGWLAHIRGWGQRVCEQELPAEQAGVAQALLLGESATMTHADWDKYVRTGVVHVLAISGQQLIVWAVVLNFALRCLGVSRKPTAIIIASFLLTYALLVGFRAPVQRAAVIACVACFAVIMRRLTLPANSFALAWLVVLALNPADPFNMGCQLSFLCIATIIWCVARWTRQDEIDPLERLIDQSRSRTERFLRSCVHAVGLMYFTTLILGIVSMPLVAARLNLVSPSGFLIGPPVVVLSSIALVAGFLMLLAAPLGLAGLFAWITRFCLSGCEFLVDRTDRLPFAHFYVPDLPEWWLWVFYAGVLTLLWWRPCWRRRNWFALAGAAWAALTLIGPSYLRSGNELRVTFLAVGHGGCTVLETPDGRVLVYDAGAMGGPEVSRRQIAPFLWSRGHRRIDELFLSHADLDHFNGVPDLLDRFEVGLVTCTPSFEEKNLPGVRRTLAAIREHNIPVRIVQTGDRLSVGDVTLEVLHPPMNGPDGNENVRSLVLRIRHRNHTILLTGDLESPGLERVTAGLTEPIDVLMSPHHGSAAANTTGLAKSARPKLVVAAEARPLRSRKDDPYAAIRAEVWVTGPEGAVTVRSGPDGLIAETYRTGKRIVIRTGFE